MNELTQPYTYPTVALHDSEFVDCVNVGMRRFLSSNGKLHNHASTYERNYLKRLEEETVGACGERAFCKWRGIYWDGSVDTFHSAPDAGRAFEVRATTLPEGRLIVRDNDAEDRVFVLVTGVPPVFTIRGWVYGGEAKQPQFYSNPNGYREAWFVPQAALHTF